MLLAMPVLAEQICRDNILLDGSFESPLLTGGSSAYRYSPTGTPWTFLGGAGIQRNGSAWGSDAAPDGSQTAFLQGVAEISQQVTLDEGYYVLYFSAAKRDYGYYNPVYVYLDNKVIWTFLAYDGEFYPSVVAFVSPSAGLHTIRFTSTNYYYEQNGGDNTVFIDAVAVTR